MLKQTRSRAARFGVLMASGALVLSACGGGGNSATQTGQAFADCDANVNTCNSASDDQLQQGGDVTYVIEKNVTNWNINSGEGNTFDIAETLRGVLPGAFYGSPDLKPTLNKDFVTSADVIKTTPMTIQYKINPKAVWNDGTPLSVDDFMYSWKTQNGKDCPGCDPASTAGYDQIDNIVGSDGGKTVTVTMKKAFTDWRQMFSSNGPMYPSHIAAQHGGVTTPDGLAASWKWFGATVPTYSAGPFKIDAFQDKVSVTESPNDKWWGAKPHLSHVIYRIITDATQEPTALQNGEVQVIYPQPQVDLVNQVKNIPNVSSHIGLGLNWEHYDFNLKNSSLAQLPLRKALFTAVNVKDIIAKTVGQFTDKVKPLENHNFMPGQDGYKDVMTSTGQGTGNLDAAKKILTDAGYKINGNQLMDPQGKAVAPMRIRYTTGNQIRQNECELFAQAAAQLGVKVNVVPTDSLGDTLQNRDYDVIVFAWVASPFPFAGGIQNWITGGGSNYGYYTNPQVDQLIQSANSETDQAKATDELNQADQLMSNDAYVLPLYQKPTFLVAQDKIANIRDNATLDGPPYNVQQWGIRKS